MINPKDVCLFLPPELKDFKRKLFMRIGSHIVKMGGRICDGDYKALDALPREVIPIVGCSPDLKPYIDKWIETGRPRIQWDRGYCRRVFATHLPRGENGGYYRWHYNSFQMSRIRNVPDARWKALDTPVKPWQRNGRHVVVACLTPTYERSHGLVGWTDATLRRLARVTDRQIVVRDKETKRSLWSDIEGAHAIVTHGSNSAVEALIMGCPAFVAGGGYSAASLIGKTDLDQIEKPSYPDRTPWLHSLAYSQFNEKELCDGTLWRLMDDGS